MKGDKRPAKGGDDPKQVTMDSESDGRNGGFALTVDSLRTPTSGSICQSGHSTSTAFRLIAPWHIIRAQLGR
jgi:hypothetical protein